jgi:hypothetical protein
MSTFTSPEGLLKMNSCRLEHSGILSNLENNLTRKYELLGKNVANTESSLGPVWS